MPVSQHEALIRLMITTSLADRSIANVELRAIKSLVETLPVFAGFDTDRLAAVAADVPHALERADGLDALLEEAKAVLSPALRETAYALAIEVASADAVAEQEELRFLELMRDALDLDPLVTAAIERSARVRYRRL